MNQGQSKKQEDLRDGERRESDVIVYVMQSPIRGGKETMFTGNVQTVLSTLTSPWKKCCIIDILSSMTVSHQYPELNSSASLLLKSLGNLKSQK